MANQVANALVLRSNQGGTFRVIPTTDGRMSIEITSSSNMLMLPLTIAQDLDRACTAMIRDFLSAWLDQHNAS